jgi:hypothetical protein
MNINTLKPKNSKKSFNDLLANLKGIYSKEELEIINNAYLQAKTLTSNEARLIREIVPIREWVNNPYYVGGSVNTLFPYWKRALIEVFESKEKINQVILTGAQGVGKTTFALLLILRKLYELSCYENVARLFNLDAISRIAFAYLSVTKDQAMNSGFAKLTEWIDDIPYFRENFKRKQGLDSALIWPDERIFVTVGSTHNHFIGLDMIGAILDEANFRETSASKDNDYNVNKKVLRLYSQVITRSQTRFIVNGVNHSLAILVSSSTHEGSFTEEVIQKSKDDPHTKIFSPSLWDVKPEAYCGERFPVFVGGNNLEPFIIKSIDDVNIVLTAFGKPNLPFDKIMDSNLNDICSALPGDVKASIIMVPIEHEAVFNLNITEGLQSLAGYSIAAISKFFSNYSAYNNACTAGMVHPFIKDEIVLSTTTNSFEDGYQPIKFYLKPDIVFSNKSFKHYIHLDLSLSGDAAGIAMAHISGYKPLYTKKLTDDQIKYGDEVEYDASLPIITIDFMLRIKPPKKPNKISLPKIRDFIIYLKQGLGINIELVTADQFQSAQLLQELSDFGIRTSNLSVDRTTDPYFTLASLFDEDRIKMYDYKPFKDELFGLSYFAGSKKIDHPKDGSKDVSDAVAGSIYNAIKSSDKSNNTAQSLVDLFVKVNTSAVSSGDPAQAAVDMLVNLLGGRNPKMPF